MKYLPPTLIHPKTPPVTARDELQSIEDATRKRGYRLVGDVDFEAISQKASLITPVPGGVGPMTITMLLYNTVESATRAAAK